MVNFIAIPVISMAIGLLAAMLWVISLPQVWASYNVATVVFLTVCVGSTLLIRKFRSR